MNYKEARDYFKSLLATYEENNCAMHPAYEFAVEALEKLELINNWVDADEATVIAELVHRYGIDAVKEACEKQTPKKPLIVREFDTSYYCPSCTINVNGETCYQLVGINDRKMFMRCPECGQKIDWRQ